MKKTEGSGKQLTEFDAWLARQNADRRLKGRAQVVSASSQKTVYYLRRPTGILGLDIALGGGWPAGGVVQIEGGESVGKTFLLDTTCGMVQQTYGEGANIVLMLTEMRKDKGIARLAGFCIAYSENEIDQLNEMRVKKGHPQFDNEELADLRTQIGNVAIVSGATAEHSFEVVLSGLETGIFQIAGIDSMGSLLTEAEDEGGVADKFYGGPAMMVTRFLNKLSPLYNLDRPDGSLLETTLIGVNQSRSNVGGGRFDRKEKPAMGAWSWKHAQLVDLLLERGAKIREGGEEGSVVGHTVRWKTLKGKAGTHDGKTGSYLYYHFPKMTPVFWRDVQENCYGGIGVYEDMVDAAKTLGVVETSGAWLTWVPPGAGKPIRAQGLDAMAQQIAESPKLGDAMREQCYEKAGLLVRFR